MNAPTNNTSHSTQENAAFPRTPEAHQQAGRVQQPKAGDRKSVVLDGSRLDREFDGRQWWITAVRAA